MGSNNHVRPRFRNLLFLLAVLSALQSQIAAHAETSQNPANKSTYIFYLENDWFAGTDQHYTKAVKFSWISKHLEKMENGRSLANVSQWFWVRRRRSPMRWRAPHRL